MDWRRAAFTEAPPEWPQPPPPNQSACNENWGCHFYDRPNALPASPNSWMSFCTLLSFHSLLRLGDSATVPIETASKYGFITFRIEELTAQPVVPLLPGLWCTCYSMYLILLYRSSRTVSVRSLILFTSPPNRR